MRDEEKVLPRPWLEEPAIVKYPVILPSQDQTWFEFKRWVLAGPDKSVVALTS